MVITPSFVRQISVPWYKIVAVPLLDVPILKDSSFANPVVEDCRNVDMSDSVIVLIGTGSDLASSNQNILEFSSSIVSLDSSNKLVKVFI